MTDEPLNLGSKRKERPRSLLVQRNAPRRSKIGASSQSSVVSPEISLNELAEYVVGYMKREGFIFTQKTDPAARSKSAVDDGEKDIVPASSLHGRYFTRIGMDLYVYLAAGQSTINYELLNNDIDLFGPKSAWRVSRKMAIVRGGNDSTLETMEDSLSEKGFVRKDASREALETSFKTNDTSRLMKGC